jgi:hypothetical protein
VSRVGRTETVGGHTVLVDGDGKPLSEQDRAEILAFATFLRIGREARHGADLDCLPEPLRAYAYGEISGRELDYRELHGFLGDDG